MHWQNILVLIAMNMNMLSLETSSAFISSVPSFRGLNQVKADPYRYISKCEDSSVSLHVRWDKVIVACEVLAKDSQDNYVSNSYFLTIDGKNFRYCHADVMLDVAKKSFKNNCFLWFSSHLWIKLKVVAEKSDNLFIVENEKMVNHNCYGRRGHSFDSSEGTPTIAIKQIRGTLCSINDKSGFHDTAAEFYTTRSNNAIQPDERTYEKCDKENLNKLVNWKNIQYACYHFKSHDRKDITNMYFGVINDRRNFRHCYGLADGFTSKCFPGPWSKNWKKWEFSNGEVDGEPNFLGLHKHNVHCYSYGDSMGDINGMKNWYAEQLPCDLYDPTGFYGYDDRKNGFYAYDRQRNEFVHTYYKRKHGKKTKVNIFLG